MTGVRAPTGAHARTLDPFPLVFLILLVLILIWLAYPALWLFALAPKGYNEGWNAFVAMRAMGELPLYPQDQTLHANNYPPLSFYLVGVLGALVGDNIFAGRIVSLISTVVIAGEIALAVRLLGGGRAVAGFAGLVFVGGLIGLDSRYIGTNDPQLLGHAVMLSGLIALLTGPDARGHLILAAVLMVVAGLIKHSLLALPLAVTAWLLLHDRRALQVWLAAACAALSGALLALWLLYGAAVFENLTSQRTYSLPRMMLVVKHALERIQVLLVGSFLLVVARPRHPPNQLVALYTVFSLLIGVLFAGGAGTAHNFFFDLLIALSLGAGLLLEQAARLVQACPPAKARAAVAAAYAIGVALSLSGDPIKLLDSQIRKAEIATRADVVFLAALEGPVMCETLALCYWAGKDLEVDTFNARQGFLVEGHDEQVLLELVRAGGFAAIQLIGSDPGRDDERISKAFMDQLYQHYRLARTSMNGDFFRPLGNQSQASRNRRRRSSSLATASRRGYNSGVISARPGEQAGGGGHR